MRILIDTREQQPFSFTRYEVATEPATLPVGDYSLPGFEDWAAIERKSLEDLIPVSWGATGIGLNGSFTGGGIMIFSP